MILEEHVPALWDRSIITIQEHIAHGSPECWYVGTAAGFSIAYHIVVNFDSGACANGAIKKKMKPAIQIEIHLYYIEFRKISHSDSHKV